jgi:hypothetical protein
LFTDDYTSAVNSAHRRVDNLSIGAAQRWPHPPQEQESTMSVTSLSFTFVNTYSAQSAKPVAAAERQAPAAQTEVKHCSEHEQRPASRPNRLVEAMMSALRELGFGSQAAAAPAATDASTASAGAQAAAAEAVSATDEAAAAAVVADSAAQTETVAASEAAAEPAQTVASAVHQFAHELFRALRQIGRGESSSEQGSRRIDGDGGRRHHHGHHGWRREGYGDMAQRLDALSQTFASPQAVAAGDAATTPLVSSSISITLTVQDGHADAPAEAVTTAAPVATSAVAEDAVQVTEAADAAVPVAAPSAAQDTAKNPLLEAFSKLFSALKPQAAVVPQADMADKLRTFLQSLAQAMRPETMSSIQAPQVGGLVNVTA